MSRSKIKTKRYILKWTALRANKINFFRKRFALSTRALLVEVYFTRYARYLETKRKSSCCSKCTKIIATRLSLATTLKILIYIYIYIALHPSIFTMYHFLHPSSSLVLSILMLLSIGSVRCFASTTIMPSHSIRAKEKAIDRFSSPFLNAKTVKMAKSMPMVTALRGGALIHDTAISAMVVCESLIWLKIWTTLASKGILESKLTRKIIHSGSAPLFMAHWPLYTSPMARALAVAVPLLQVGR